jgi:hypothetical protein
MFRAKEKRKKKGLEPSEQEIPGLKIARKQRLKLIPADLAC